ncbi:hypothetical protein B566_EDAN011502 [Ephemera danica]|nr:hypothetical protein B566_EDAN011502 [Ephemera danica]
MTKFVGVVLLTLTLCLAGAKDSNGLKYEAPDDCQWTVRHVHGNDEVALSCRVRSINSEIDSTNFSVIPAEHTTSLSVECNPELNSRSSLPDRSFAHLSRLREFALLHCKLPKLASGSLHGLHELRNLTVQTYNEAWPLEIAPYSFAHVRLLEKLDLSFNNLWTVPEAIFCPLVNLVALNVSHNHLQDIDDFGFRSARVSDEDLLLDGTAASPLATSDTLGKRACGLDIQILDASFNSFGHIPARSLSSLRRLHELRLTNNDLTSLSDRALNGLKSLRIFDVSNNKLVALPPALFSDCGDVRELHLQNNSLGSLAPGLLSGLKHLLSLDLSRNRLSSSWMDSSTFSGLIRLVLMDLSRNKISSLNPEYFKDLYTLQILNLEHNSLESLPADTFAPMSNLHTLVLSYNRIKSLDAASFSGLFALSLLALDNNQLTDLHADALRNCTGLQDLNLNGNALTAVPVALSDMRLLKTLDLGENNVHVLEEPGFKGMNNLYGLRLIGNNIKSLSRNTFAELPALQIVNLARNQITKVDMGTFDTNNNLQAVRLDANGLTDITGLFSKLPNLVWLNISDNQLNWFDYALVPKSLQWLDLHRNKIKEIGDARGRLAEMKIQTLDISFNLLSRVAPSSFPPSIEIVFINDNQVTTVEPHTFVGKVNLTRVDLYANQITGMDLSAVSLTPVSAERPLPEFYIGGNPFRCDCTMEWLQRINKLDHLRQHPRIMDLDSVYCRLPYSRHRRFVSLVEADSSHFVCRYETHCFATCHCCDFNACDCKMQCPSNCTCYHDQTWSAANIVDCSSANHVQLPNNIPMDATEVYLDGNSLGDLSSHLFIGRKYIRALYVNGSKVDSIHNDTFTGMKQLKFLYLQDNYLEELTGSEFHCLEELRELYLHNNRLTYIDNRTFADLRQLEVLRLDGNRLQNFPVWQFTLNPYLARVTLADNNWSCHCHFMRDFRTWLKVNLAKVSDVTRVACVLRIKPSKDGSVTKQHGPHMADFNTTACSSFLTGGGYLDAEYDERSVSLRAIRNYVPLIIAVVTAFIFAICLIFAVAYHRKQLRLWMYSRCGVKICYFSSTHASSSALDEMDERSRQFDAFVSYSSRDESFVSQVLAPALEPQLRLCLQHRDCTSGAALLDFMENSRRTILVLSPHFLATEWRRAELRSALKEAAQRDLRRRRKVRLVAVTLTELPSRDLDPDLRMSLSKATCLRWGDKRFWQRLRTAMPDRDGLSVSTNHSSRSLCCCAPVRDSSVCASSSVDSSRVVYEYSSIVGPPPITPHDCYETLGPVPEPPPLRFLPAAQPRYGVSSLRRQQQQEPCSLWA